MYLEYVRHCPKHYRYQINNVLRPQKIKSSRGTQIDKRIDVIEHWICSERSCAVSSALNNFLKNSPPIKQSNLFHFPRILITYLELGR